MNGDFDPMTPETSFERFIQERKFLKNVSPRTLEYYEGCFRAWQRHGTDPKQFVVNMRSGGARASSVNCVSRGLNAYFKWAGLPHKIPRLKEEERVIETWSEADVKKFLHYKPRTKGLKRAQMCCLLLLDTGLRIDEALSIKKDHINFENLFIRVTGKGRKERDVPFSLELRKRLWKYNAEILNGYLFATRDGVKLGHRNITRDVMRLCDEVGVTLKRRLLHSFRHTFATNFLKMGGNVFMLQRILGHQSLEITRRYCHFVSEDLVLNHRSMLTA
jgi:integrase/recombinase XerD